MNWPLLQNSLLVSGAATLLAVFFGFVMALWLAGLSKRWRNGLLAAAVVAFALPPFLVTGIWIDLLGQTGVWHRWLPLNIYSPGGTAWILTLLTWPVTLFAVLGCWSRLDPAQLESDPALAQWMLIRSLLIPVARRSTALAAVLTFVLALNNFAVPAILQTKVFPAEIWLRFNTTFDYTAALQLSWPLIAAPLLLLAMFRGREWNWPDSAGRERARAFRRQLGTRWFAACAAAGVMILTLSAGLPVGRLLVNGRTWIELTGALAAGKMAVCNSFLLAAGAATLTIALGLFGRRWRIGVWLWIPFLVPGVLLGIGLICALNRPPFIAFYQSAGVVLLALTIRYLALGWHGSNLALRQVDRNLTDAAQLGGASRWQLFSQVEWPQIAPFVAATWYVVYLLCLWDVETLVLVIPPGGETLALRVFNLLHYGHNAQVNALCLLLLALALLPLLAVAAFVRTRDFFMRRIRADSSRVLTNAATGSMLAAALGLAGCVPHGGSTEAGLNSRLFSGVEVIGTRGTGAGQFNKPRSVAVDSADNLYVVDMTGRLQKFSPQGAFLASYQMPETVKGRAKGMCRDEQGNIVVVEPHYTRINHFSPDLKLVRQWGVSGTNAGQLAFPRAVAVNSRGEMFLSEYMFVERVQKFALESVVSGQWSVAEAIAGTNRQTTTGYGPWTTDQEKLPFLKFVAGFGHAGQGPGEFNRPEGLGIDAVDRVYVADSCNHRIQVFSSDGAFLRAYGQAGSGPGELSYPYDVRVDKAGRQYVCEFGNSRVQVFDAADRPVEILGGVGSTPGRMNNPWAIAFDSKENLYVADAGNHRVLKFIRRESVVSGQWSVAKAAARLVHNWSQQTVAEGRGRSSDPSFGHHFHEPAEGGRARHSVRAVRLLRPSSRRARSDAPYLKVHGEGLGEILPNTHFALCLPEPERRAPAWRGAVVEGWIAAEHVLGAPSGRFMGSLLDLSATHWDHEPVAARLEDRAHWQPRMAVSTGRFMGRGAAELLHSPRADCAKTLRQSKGTDYGPLSTD